MPPKAAAPPRVPSPVASPPPPPNDANDILVIQDFMDTIDQIPVELTRVHSDLNELGAVLYSTLCNLEKKLHQLIDWVQDPSIGPERRFQLLQEIAEEAARYKLGGDDKIRVAGGACDGIMAHQRHILRLLNSSSLLQSDPLSPYSYAMTLPAMPAPTATRRGGRTTGSPFTGRDGGGTPTKRKKNRANKNDRDDDDTSSVNGREEKKKKSASRKKRAASPTDSIASGVYPKPPKPQTARQLAAEEARKAKAAAKQDDSDEDSGDEEPKRSKALPMAATVSNDSLAPNGALGIDIGLSRENSNTGKTVPGAPAADKSRSSRVRKRGRDDEEEDEEEEGEDDEARPAKRTTTVVKKGAVDDLERDGRETTGGDNEADTRVYCTCHQLSYGEMIGCDNTDTCPVEWFHVKCVGLEQPLPEIWFCPSCVVSLGLSSSDGRIEGKKRRKGKK